MPIQISQYRLLIAIQVVNRNTTHNNLFASAIKYIKQILMRKQQLTNGLKIISNPAVNLNLSTFICTFECIKH